MIPEPAQYLLRFDDLCPTISPKSWDRFAMLLEEFGVRPILGVVPENRDPDLERAPADPDFWERMRRLEASGATVAVHGYRHLCESQGKSLLGIHRWNEFAGVTYEIQREWIRAGFRILREKGLHPRLWIGPRHGFDRNTLRALTIHGVHYISDGFARVPFRRHGITWIPQQLWGPMRKKKGLWTICIHPWAAGHSDAEQLRRFLENHGHQFTSFDRVITELPAKPLGFGERIYERIARGRVQSRSRRQRQRKSRPEGFSVGV
jgi:predicted deacetylase